LDSHLFVCQLSRTASRLASYLDAACAEVGVSSLEAQALSHLGGSGGSSISELQKTMGVRPSTLTSVLDRLSERRMIKREVCPDDRRSFLVRLTQKGNDTSHRISKVIRSFEESISSELSARQIQGFQVVLDAIDRESQTPAPYTCQTHNSK